MSKEQEKQLYFDWLCSIIEARRGSASAKIAKVLFALPYEAVVRLDENRVEDGVTLRSEYAFEAALDEVPDWGECTFLEMLIALSERMGMQIDMNTATCFWHLMKNLGFRKYSDPDPVALRKAVDRVTSRTFESDGAGGLFPLKEATTNQREEQIYRQMQLYILELDL